MIKLLQKVSYEKKNNMSKFPEKNHPDPTPDTRNPAPGTRGSPKDINLPTQGTQGVRGTMPTGEATSSNPAAAPNSGAPTSTSDSGTGSNILL